jgi:hypothetical protein
MVVKLIKGTFRSSKKIVRLQVSFYIIDMVQTSVVDPKLFVTDP